MQRLRPGTWQGREVALVFLLMILVPGMTQGFLEGIGFYQEFYGKEPTGEQKQLWYMALAFPIIVAGTFLILFTLSRTRPRHIGLSTGRWPQNIILGWLVWFPLTIFTLVLYAEVKRWIPAKEHPLSLLEKQAGVPEWLLGILLAVVIAPFLEELVFRGVLQGWLRRCSLLGHAVVAVCTLFVGALPVIDYAQQTREKAVDLNLGPPIFALALVAGYVAIVQWLWRQRPAWLSNSLSIDSARQIPVSPETTDAFREGKPPIPLGEISTQLTTTLPTPAIMPSRQEQQKVQQPAALAAIFGSSMLFAVFHSSVWPTPIPLFFLGLGLGWLAYRTQSLVSSITVHFLFNSVACVVLALSVIYGEENGKEQTDAGRPSVAGSNSTLVPGSWWPRFK
jgi:membrane protease YdiL (CAAX protease family)